MLKDLKEDLDGTSAHVAFPAEAAAEEQEQKGPLDQPDQEELSAPPEASATSHPVNHGLTEAEEAEEELLDSLKLEGFPKAEKDRRIEWMRLPRSVRLAVRRLHHNFGSHKPHGQSSGCSPSR